MIEIKNRYSGKVIKSLDVANLRGADLCDANLRGADLCDADLCGANLRGAKNIPDAPVVENIDAKILAAISADGCKLEMGNWHSCATTHCRAGWAITLAGESGKELERKTSPDTAGQLIYMASRPGVPVPDFYADNETALKSIQEDASKYSK